MKLMKHITIALVLCAIPAMAFAQTAGCTDCDHTVSYYKGTGGLIATAGEDAEKVNFVATCDGTTRTGELTPNDDGVVAMLLTGDYACDADKGSFDIGPITDGGWYWINDEDNSAIGNLVAKDTLDNAATELTGAGDGVTMMAGSGAVFVKETATGRVGILPNILPDPPVAPLTKCGFSSKGTGADTVYSRRTGACAMGDGGTITLATITDGFTGKTLQLMDKATITRPGGTAQQVITIDLWGNGSGHFTTSADDSADARLGHTDFAGTAARAATRLTGVTIAGTVGASGPTLGADLGSTANAGVTLETGTDSATVGVGADPAYCSTKNDHNATVSIAATMSTPDVVTPSIKTTATGVAGGITFTVVCPAAELNAGQELVPDNPFPTDK